MQKIKKGDNVIVIAGRDKGKRGAVVRRLDGDHVIVEGVNRAKKHQKPNPMRGIAGGIADKDMPIHISNIAMYNPQTKKADRVGFKTIGEGTAARSVRFFKSNGEVVDAK